MPKNKDSKAELKAKLKKISKEAAKKADKELGKELTALLEATSTDLKNLKPKITDKATYDKLIAAVKESTAKNENLAQLKQRLEALGTGVLDIGKIAVKMLKGF